MIKTYNQFINESVYVDKFLQLYDNAPSSLKKEIDDTKNVLQSVEWHPEGPTFVHIRLVTNRLENCYHDVNLTLAGLFHDLGKTYVTKPNGRGGWSAHGHEDESVKIVEQYQDWITKMGGDVDIVKYVVANHMRYKVIDEMRTQEQIRFMDEEYFPYVQKFATADFGGTDLNCKEINNQEEIKEKLKEFKKREEDNKIINSKFNGRMVMDKYPELKGKSLGDALTNFKNSFDDFNEYVFNNPSDKIMKRFDDFISNKVVSNKSATNNFATNESIRDKMTPKSEEDIKKYLDKLTPNQKLIIGAKEGIFWLIKQTLEEGADIHYFDDIVLQLTIDEEGTNMELLKYILKKGANVNALDDYALRYACEYGQLDVIELLLKYGANPHANSDYAIQIAEEDGRKDIIELFKKYGHINESIRDKMIPKSEEEMRKSLEHLDNGSKLLKGCSMGILWLVKELVEGGIDVNRAGSYALELAIIYNQYEIVEYLINNGSYIHNRFIDEAKDRKYHKILDLLLDYKNNR